MAFPLKLPKWSEWSRHQRLLAFGGALLWSVVLLDRAVLKPWAEHAEHVHNDIVRLEEDMRRAERLLSRQAKISGEVEAYREELAGTAAATDMASLIREIEGLGQESGILLGAVKPLEQSAELAEAFTVDVEYQGTLQQWVHFLYLIGHSQSLLEVQRATLGLQAEGTAILEGSMRLSSQLNRGQAI